MTDFARCSVCSKVVTKQLFGKKRQKNTCTIYGNAVILTCTQQHASHTKTLLHMHAISRMLLANELFHINISARERANRGYGCLLETLCPRPPPKRRPYCVEIYYNGIPLHLI